MYVYIHIYTILLRYFDLPSITLRQTVAVQRPSSNAHLHNGSIRFLRSRERLPILYRAQFRILCLISKSLYTYFRKYISNPSFDHSFRNILFIAIIKGLRIITFGNKVSKCYSLSSIFILKISDTDRLRQSILPLKRFIK